MLSLNEVRQLKPRASLARYRLLNQTLFRRVVNNAKKLEGVSVLHISSTANGGGVSELLRSQIPFERLLGLKSRWFVIEAPQTFFAVTKEIHNSLQGKRDPLTRAERNEYLRINRLLAPSLARIITRHNPRIIVFHDPQPLPLIEHIPDLVTAISRIHIDLSTPQRTAFELIAPFIARCNRIVVNNPAFQKSIRGIPRSKITTIFPAIDPFTKKNLPMASGTAQQIIKRFGIDPRAPLVSQVSRFDPWKDPLGVIEAFRKASKRVPNLQLVLAGFSIAADDPESSRVYQMAKAYANKDANIYLFIDPRRLGKISNDIFINALYTTSDVVLQKSIREGFGLTVTEAMWKGKPVVAGTTLGTRAQIKNGKNGVLVRSPYGAARAIVALINNEAYRSKLGKAAHRSVAKKFLMPRFIEDNLRLYRELSR